jgi:hypothetical protein
MGTFVRAGQYVLNLDAISTIILPTKPGEKLVYHIMGNPALSALEGFDGQIMSDQIKRHLEGDNGVRDAIQRPEGRD